MCLEHLKFSKLMRNPEFMWNILAFVVDEAHCISQWDDLFWKKYAELGKLRSFVPDYVPILVTSATMPPHILHNIQLKLCLTKSQTFTVNLGNNRPNITPIICWMHGTANDLDVLNFSIEEANAPVQSHLYGQSSTLTPTILPTRGTNIFAALFLHTQNSKSNFYTRVNQSMQNARS